MVSLRVLRADDARALALLLRDNRDFLAPWEPVRDDDYFTVEGQQRVIEDALSEREADRHVAFAFGALGLHRLQAETLPHNTASRRVLEQNDFVRFGEAPAYLKIAGTWQDCVLYQALA